ncbi:MAG: purine-nucleoside phosphorylase [Gemmatimonadales bacterium]
MDGTVPEVAIVLGSGLGGLTDSIESSVRIPYQEVPGFPVTSVEGHAGELVYGTLSGKRVLVQSGRFHMYEGHSAEVSARAVRVFGELGIGTMIVTNSAGGIRRSVTAGTLMLITDHLNLTGSNPLTGPVLEGEERFPDMSSAYDPGLRDIALRVARENGIRLEEGVYAGVAGPSYETPAEIRMLERLGADAVGMSTVVEVIVARARGIRCLGISTITNRAADANNAPLSHAEVLKVAAGTGEKLTSLLAGIVELV